MYLSRLILNPLSRQVQQEIANPYQMHRTILHAFPQDLRANGERVLFRVDALPRTGQLHLLVQSQGKPDWTWLASRDGRRPYLAASDRPNPAVKQTDLQGRRPSARLSVVGQPHQAARQVVRPRQGRASASTQPKNRWPGYNAKADQSGFTVLTAVPPQPPRSPTGRRRRVALRPFRHLAGAAAGHSPRGGSQRDWQAKPLASACCRWPAPVAQRSPGRRSAESSLGCCRRV